MLIALYLSELLLFTTLLLTRGEEIKLIFDTQQVSRFTKNTVVDCRIFLTYSNAWTARFFSRFLVKGTYAMYMFTGPLFSSQVHGKSFLLYKVLVIPMFLF